MDANTQQVLQDLKPGSEAQFFTDAMAMQVSKTGLMIATALCGITFIYNVLCSLGVFGHAKRSLFAIVLVAVSGVGGYLLNEKAQAMKVIDDSRPVIAITGYKLDYDVRRSGWSVPWNSINAIELKTTKTFVKNSVEQISYEIQVKVKQGAHVEWKYEPTIQNDMATVKSLLEKRGYLVIDPEPLGISPPALQMALEKYRAGL